MVPHSTVISVACNSDSEILAALQIVETVARTQGRHRLDAEEVIEERNVRTSRISPGSIKPFYARPHNLLDPLADEFAQFAWSVDFGLSMPFVAAKLL